MSSNPDQDSFVERTRELFLPVKRDIFLLHIRPKVYEREAVCIKNTWLLGFLCMFFFMLESVTGLFLMIYYVPSPEGAYESIQRIMYEVPFGSLMRDLHRLGGELMIVVVALHMARVFLTDSYRKRQAFTWLTGIVLLVLTLFLGFSGYLLPWDQLAYWAVTIGTSMADTIPVFGTTITNLLRGGPEFNGDGLLRFYVLHILGLPFTMLLLAGIHYFRVVRHGITLPVGMELKKTVEQKREKKKLIPEVILHEGYLISLLLIVLLALCTFFYDAPLEHHANPKHTPVDTAAPWFFLWLQGMLKLGDTLLFGVCLPIGLLTFLTFLPIFRKGERKIIRERPVSLLFFLLLCIFLVVSTYFGNPKYGIHMHPVSRILYSYVPEEGENIIQQLGYQKLNPGVLLIDAGNPEGSNITGYLGNDFLQQLVTLKNQQQFSEVQGVILIEEWQENLKRVVIRIIWQQNGSTKKHTLARTVFISGFTGIEEERP